MQWFAGNVQTAIQISRKNHALLIVYITNDTDEGRLFDGFWEKIDSANLLCPVVGIKLNAGETAAQQFADIYPIPILPAAYLINQAGEPLEVITTLIGKEYDQFRAKFNKAVEQFLKSLGDRPAAPTASTAASTVPPPQSAPVAAPVAREPAPTPAAPQNDPELAEKVARAKELLKVKKQKEEEQRREAEKHQKEELMKAQKSKQEREDKALMEAAKQRKKEKLEADKEKQRILAQIKADREDRKKRFGTKTENSEAPVAEKKSPESTSAPVASDRCRLQVRLPDGSTFVEEFPSNDVLNSLVEIIRQKPTISGAFEVSQTYPRRVFTTDDYSKTFLENRLTPSSVLVVIQKATPPSAVVTASSSLFTMFFSPLMFVWNFISGWFTGMATTGSNAQKAKKNPRNEAGPQNPGAARARGMPRVAEVRRRGNVAGLENPNDDDPEERANFNGNSTQFM